MGALYLENHDQPRSVSKYIPKHDINQYSKKMLGTLFMMLRGTPFIYQGQELGMTNIEMDSMEEYEDIATHDQYKRALLTGLSKEKAFKMISKRSRDNSRTPMQWDDSDQAGFSDGDTTWLKVNPNYTEINAEKESQDDRSALSYYKKLIELRMTSNYREVIVYGKFVPDRTANDQTLVYERVWQDTKLLTAINFTNEKQTITIDKNYTQVVLSNYEGVRINEKVCLRPYESIVLANR
ncbi:alpha-amylase family glycosyl hydrolase [Alkalibacterium sp. 20]|uniref:alpha-amylase family glycosyl hydrolase n=1 Tax=Alkalibacterium sp. 20 TaxID=1798803 RepID=UPI0021090D86|nr:alpha-amylase family glycosyl hydrolase [Alkalibacterium sp. 20]